MRDKNDGGTGMSYNNTDFQNIISLFHYNGSHYEHYNNDNLFVRRTIAKIPQPCTVHKSALHAHLDIH